MSVLTKLPRQLSLAAALLCSLPHSASAQTGLIRERRQLPDDPLAGLGENSDGRRQGKNQAKPNKGAAQCQLVPRAADSNTIGDLRAMLLAARHAPKTVPCEPGQVSKGDLRLRIGITGQGKVEHGEIQSGDTRLGTLVLAKLTGQTCAPRPLGATVGEIILAIKAPKRPG